MTHLMRYAGRFEKNFKRLTPKPEYYINPDNRRIPVLPKPLGFKGAMVYMMEDMTTGKAIPMLVMVEDVILKNPLQIDYAKHTEGTRVGPRGIELVDQCLASLLDDAMSINPKLKNRLETVKKRKLQKP